MPFGDIALLFGDRPGREPTRLELLLRAFRANRSGTLDAATRAELRAEIVRGLFIQAPGILVIEMGVALLVAGVFWRSASPTIVVSWAALVIAAAIVRWVHCRRYFERARPIDEAPRWGRTFAWGTLLSGMLWGIAGVAFFSPHSGVLLIVLVFLVTGLSAAALTGYTAHLPAFYAFVLPAVVPFGVRLMLDGAPVHVFTATLLAVWITIFVYLAHTLNAHTLDRVLLLLGNGHMADTLRKARDAADEANQAKTRFLANMSHELRTPLNAIIGFSDIMRNELYGGLGHAKYMQYAGDINRSGSHLLQLINDILDVAKIEVGGQALNEAVIDLGGTLKQCAQLVEVQAREAGIGFSVEVSPRLPGLRADPTRFRQIVLNLVSNAVKFTPAGGKVWLTAGLDQGGDVLIQVRDTGIGMKVEDVPKALMPFVQLGRDAPRGDPGTGLGLPLVKTLVEAHGGKLAIESEPGKGTIVSVHLPKTRLAPIGLAETDPVPLKVA
ncbi:MAG: HAMP domain-containing histidine kinase [Rhodospirillaceae bacterium]|nr:HAMP domain-containing histidine kinase [Rhodospirillaceae bacterium]